MTAFPGTGKDKCAEELDIWKKTAETKTGKKLKVVRCDNAPELLKVVNQWTRQDGVQVNPTAIDTSSQNGMAERGIQTIKQISRALLADVNLLITLWPWVVLIVVYICNRTAVGLIINEKKVTPYKAWNGERPSIDYIYIWGCRCVAYIPENEQQSKLHLRGMAGVFIGYVPNMNH